MRVVLATIAVIITILPSCENQEPCMSSEWYEDKDGDGLGNPNVSVISCEQPNDFVDNHEDKDDNDTTNCTNPTLWFLDADNDGLGNPDVSLESCEEPEGYVSNSGDTDDTPCTETMWYLDNDGDGKGNINVSTVSCERPYNYVNNPDDQDDNSGLFTSDELIYYDADLAYDGFVLLNELASNNTRLIAKDGTVIASWEFGEANQLGNDAELLDNGYLLSAHKINSTPISQGGYGGKVEIRDVERNVIWHYIMSSVDGVQHHDVEMLPNGNILIMAWEVRDQNAIRAKGYIGSANTLNTESLYEINPENNEIVWEWHVWDHMIQDQEASSETYGQLSDNPQKININYNTDTHEFIHCNGIDYDPEKDIIYISARHYSEIWVIDHSTTTDEAKGPKGDLIYRFGNPETWNGPGERLLFKQHFPNLLEGNVPGKGNILVFNNEYSEFESAVTEFKLPEVFDFNSQPVIVWEYINSEIKSPILSGAERLPNGNTLISSGVHGLIIEVTPEDHIVWQFQLANSPSRIWKTYSYEKDFEGIKALNL